MNVYEQTSRLNSTVKSSVLCKNGITGISETGDFAVMVSRVLLHTLHETVVDGMPRRRKQPLKMSPAPAYYSCYRHMVGPRP